MSATASQLILLIPVGIAKRGDMGEPVMVPYDSDGKQDRDTALATASQLANERGTYVQIVERTFTFERDRLISTACPPEAP